MKKKILMQLKSPWREHRDQADQNLTTSDRKTEWSLQTEWPTQDERGRRFRCSIKYLQNSTIKKEQNVA